MPTTGPVAAEDVPTDANDVTGDSSSARDDLEVEGKNDKGKVDELLTNRDLQDESVSIPIVNEGGKGDESVSAVTEKSPPGADDSDGDEDNSSSIVPEDLTPTVSTARSQQLRRLPLHRVSSRRSSKRRSSGTSSRAGNDDSDDDEVKGNIISSIYFLYLHLRNINVTCVCVYCSELGVGLFSTKPSQERSGCTVGLLSRAA